MEFDLKSLNNVSQDEMSSKNIICFKRNSSYLEELKEDMPVVYAGISFIVDANPRYQVPITVDERKIEVKAPDALSMIDFTKTVLLITDDYYNEAYEELMGILREIGVSSATIYYYVNRETEIELSYRRKYENTPLKDIIVFRSGPHSSSYVKGTDFADNARALFEHMLKLGLNQRYELVWVVKDPDEFIKPTGKYFDNYLEYPNLTFVSFDDSTSENLTKRDEYYRILCLAKWFFMTDAYGFCRNARKDQIRVQLWHGCGFKTRTNFVSCENRYEYNIVIGEKYKEIHSRIYGLRADQVLITGYPKNDWIYHPLSKAAERLGFIKDNHEQRVILWLPTFRKAKSNLSELDEKSQTSTGLPLINSMADMKILNAALLDLNIKMIIKLHPFQNGQAVNDFTKTQDLSQIKVIDNEQLVDVDASIEQLLAYADALISDYSSVAVEYLLLDRPLAFTLDDVEEYENSRGFVFDNIREWLPGKELYSLKDFLEYVDEIAHGVDSSFTKRTKIAGIMHKYKDDSSSERVLKSLNIIFDKSCNIQ